MNHIRIKEMTHRCRCQVPGCQNRNALKISRRDDVNGRPMFLCPDCIKDIHNVYTAIVQPQASFEDESEKSENFDVETEEKNESNDDIAESSTAQRRNAGRRR